MYKSEKEKNNMNKLNVVKSKYIESQELTWKELFDGYTELYAITFSSGLQFMNDLIEKFNHAEVIFGCEDVMNSSLSYIMALETTIIEQITKKKALVNLSKAITDGKLEFYISRDTRSHEKIYLLRNEDGNTRVITGSANMSGSAFNGYQRENITYYDDPEAFNWYFKRFVDFRDMCSSEVNKNVITKIYAEGIKLQEHPEELSVVKQAQAAIVEISNDSPDINEVEIVTSVKGLESELKPMLPTPKKNKITFSVKEVSTFIKKHREYQIVKEEKKKAFPKLHIDYDTEKLDFNGQDMSLEPSAEEIENDAECIVNYLDSLSEVYGNTKQAQADYFSFMNWYYASIFMPYLRWYASKSEDALHRFPVYGILYGPSNGGKSTFVKLLAKSMCGKSIPFNSSSDFTTTNVTKLKRGCEGLPINIDDLDKEQFSNHMRMIKADEWGIPEHFINYPAVSMTTNKVPSIEAAISKRMVAFYIDLGIDREYGLKMAKKINNQIKKTGTGLYREYIRLMLPKIHTMIEKMNSEEEYQPDIFSISSETLVQLFQEAGCTAPYIRALTISDYMGDKVVGRNAIEKIRKAWENEKDQFLIDRKHNRLSYSIPKYGNSYELKYIADELPVFLNSVRTGTSLTMDLDKAEEFFDIKFKKKLWNF